MHYSSFHHRSELCANTQSLSEILRDITIESTQIGQKPFEPAQDLHLSAFRYVIYSRSNRITVLSQTL